MAERYLDHLTSRSVCYRDFSQRRVPYRRDPICDAIS
jgi:hypothetical protein